MQMKHYPAIDPEATGRQIVRLRKERGLTVRDMQNWFGFDAPQAIYKWQKGQTLPSVDNLYALSILLEVPMNAILVQVNRPQRNERQDNSCRPVFLFFTESPGRTVSFDSVLSSSYRTGSAPHRSCPV